MSSIKHVNSVMFGDNLELLRRFPSNTFSAVVTDPPYGLSQQPDMREVLRHWLNGDDYEHRGGGFMGKKWDSFVPGPKVWEEVMRVIKPGAHILSFGGTRTYGLMETAMRLAGAEIRDKVDYFCDVTGYTDWIYGCLSEDAEILTEDGWKKGVDVVEGERVMAWDSETEALRLSPVLEKTVAPYQGDMVAFKNDNTDQLLTPNHRVYKKSRIRKMVDGERKCWFEKDWTVQSAGEINRWNPVFVPLAGWHDGKGIGGEDYASLLGWIWTEGGFDNGSSTGVRIYQSSVNQEYVDEISDLLSRMVPYVENTWFFTGEMAQRVRKDLPNKHPTWELMWRMTEEEKLAFIDAALKGDGSSKGDGKSWAFYQKDLADLEWFQALLHMVGMQGRINEKKLCVELHENPVTQFQCRHLKHDKVAYDGEVWCVRVETGAFVARRNGRIFVTGNSGFPKSHNIGKAVDKKNGKPSRSIELEQYLTKKLYEKYSHHKYLANEMEIAESLIRHWIGKCGTQFMIPTLKQYKILKEKLELDDRYDYLIEWEEAKREVIGKKMSGLGSGKTFAFTDKNNKAKKEIDITIPKTEQAKQWEGWGTALKPAHEPVAIVSKSDEEGSLPEPPQSEDGVPFKYQAKAPKAERNKGVELHWLDGELIGQERYEALEKENEERKDEDGFKKHGISKGNVHPTVKPLELCRYLVRMVKQPEQNLILDPWCGSGSILVACVLEGCDFVGMDNDEMSVHVSNARIRDARENG